MTCAAYGTTRDGHAVGLHTLANSKGLRLRVLDMGGTIVGIDVPVTAGHRNVVVGLADLAAYEAKAWFNCLIGRFANRLKHGFSLDGKQYQPPADENGVTLHGGRPLSWGIRMWDVVRASDSELVLRLVSPDGDQGFPGTMTVEVTYSVTENDEVRLDYRATTDAPTLVNLTNHLYFNLAGHGSAEGAQVQILADGFTPTDDLQIPTGEIAPVAGTAFDFRQPTALGARIRAADPQLRVPRGYDHNFVLRKSSAGALEPAVVMQDGGITMTLLTTQPGIQVYSANSLYGNLLNAAGEMIRQGDALALETQHFPDSPNQAGFPSTVLRPGETFTSTTIFRFTT